MFRVQVIVLEKFNELKRTSRDYGDCLREQKGGIREVLVIDSYQQDGDLHSIDGEFADMFRPLDSVRKNDEMFSRGLERMEKDVIRNVTMPQYEARWKDVYGDLSVSSFQTTSMRINGSPYIGIKESNCWPLRMLVCVLEV